MEQERADILKRRQAWFDDQLDLDPARLVFIDETGLSTKMARLRGRAPRGERCRAGIPHGHWKTTTFTGALRLTGLTAPMVLDGAMNGIAFRAYVEQVLVPTLAPGAIVIMDKPACAQGRRRPPRDRAGRRRVALPAALQSRLQPDRNGLLQAQGGDEIKGRKDSRRAVGCSRPRHPALQARRMRQLFRRCRL